MVDRGVVKNGYLLDLESTIGDVFENGDTLQYVLVPLESSAAPFSKRQISKDSLSGAALKRCGSALR